VETFNTVTAITRKLEQIAGDIDRKEMAKLMAARNPAKTLASMYRHLM